HALQIGELLVEKGAKPVQLILVAQFLGADDLVELRGEYLVVNIPRQRREGILVALGLARSLGIDVLFVRQVVRRGVRRLRLDCLLVILGSFGIVRLRIVAPGIVLAAFLALILPLRLVFLAVLVFLALFLVAELLGHIHGGEHVAYDTGERLLVAQLGRQAVQIGPGLLLDPRTPQLNEPLRAFRRRAPCQLLAHQPRQRFFQPRVRTVRGVAQIGPGVLVLQHGGDVVRHALHYSGADRLDASLLDSIEHGAGELALGGELQVNALVMAGTFERHGIAKATGDGDIHPGGLLPRFGQSGAAARQRRPILGEADLEFLVAGYGAYADHHRALEGVGIGAAFRPVAGIVAGSG